MTARTAGEIDVLLGARLCALRQLRHRSCRRLAAEARINVTTLYRYECGLTCIPAAALVDFGRALDFPVSAFFDGITTEETAHAA